MDVPFTITYNERKKTEASPSPSKKKQHGIDAISTPILTPRKQKSDKINTKQIVTKKYEKGSPRGPGKVEQLSPIFEDRSSETKLAKRPAE